METNRETKKGSLLKKRENREKYLKYQGLFRVENSVENVQNYGKVIFSMYCKDTVYSLFCNILGS